MPFTDSAFGGDCRAMIDALRQCLPLIDAYRRVSGGDGDATAALVRAVLDRATKEGTDEQVRFVDGSDDGGSH